MPIDFERIPPRIGVPAVPRPSAIVWIPLLCLALCVGVTMTVLGWATGSPTSSAWFWLCAVGYPILGWSLLLVSSLAYGHTVRRSALAQNRVSDQAEQACHDEASEPFAIIGYAWRFSSDKGENSLRSVLEGKAQSGLRPSAAFPRNDVHARWIDVPGEPFYPGNELGEHTRHLAVCEWLIACLLDDLSESLASLPAQTRLRVHLCVHSRLKSTSVVEQLRAALKDRRAPTDRRIDREESLSIFATDDWLDRRDEQTVHLVIAMQLRDAISTMLDGGVAEAGAALLIGNPRLLKDASTHVLRLHRPARGTMNTAAEVIELASRWGKTDTKNLDAAWVQGLPVDDLGSLRKSANLNEALPWRQIEASVGDCSDAGGWLAVALAAASADSSSNPQLVLCTQGNELTALVCRKET
ncbi:hypothetical protein CR51_28785 [Caballeronia megalochromosomata]|jgi:hypothetical protein|nr:hypothetical protein CR51_28785 [Caballeronia megalochromosomata]